MVPSFCDKNNCYSGFFPSTVKYFTETYCDSTKCIWVIGVEASSERAVSDSWAIKLLAGVVLSLTVQALLKEKNKALCKGATYATQRAFQASGFFFPIFFKSKGQSTICLVSLNSSTPHRSGSNSMWDLHWAPCSKTSVTCWSLPLRHGNPLSHVGRWALSEMVQCYINFVIISGDKDGNVLM